MILQLPSFGDLDIRSVAGCATRVLVPHYKAVFDLGENDRNTLTTPKVFLSHTHTDHMSGIWQHAALRGLTGKQVPTYIVPVEWAERVANLMKAAMACDGAEIPHRLELLGRGEIHSLSPERFVRPFETFHRVPSQGYAVVKATKKLKAKYQGLPGTELANLRREGTLLEEYFHEVEFAYTGDTTIEVLGSEDVRKAKVLVMEVTYVGDEISVADARRHGHIHIKEVAAHAEEFKNEHIVLMHFSKRFHADEIWSEVNKHLPEHLRDRVHVVLDQH